jgi:hypothetical protein
MKRASYLKFVLDRICLLLILLSSSSIIFAQSALDSAKLKNLHGRIQTFAQITQKDTMVLICFWATYSDPSIAELNAINQRYEQWQAGLKFRLMIVAIDEAKTWGKIRPMVNMNGWTFDVYTDINGDLKKALHADNLPESMILKKGKLIYQQSGYETGSENYLFQRLISLSNTK